MARTGITTTSFIKRYINKLPKGELFTTREFLPYVPRSAVDKALSFSSSEPTVYSINGGSSSFMLGNRRIHFKQTSPRKMQLPDNRIGRLIRGLWHLGKNHCDEFALEIATQTLHNQNNRIRIEVRQLANIMPPWLADQLPLFAFSPAVP